MTNYNYSPAQLEKTAEQLLWKFDPERLTGPKPIDVYEVIEKCLDVPYDWKYLTPDQSILGMTFFDDGWTWAWPEPYYEDGMLPFQVEEQKGTILIEETLTEEENRGRENFTVMHEVFHQVLPHRRCFSCGAVDYAYFTHADMPKTRKPRMTSLEICEYQANACAAAFLMPREAVTNQLRRYAGRKVLRLADYEDYAIVRLLAEDFSVSVTAMKYRLLNLKLAV